MKRTIFAALVAATIMCSCTSGEDISTTTPQEETTGNTMFRFSTSAVSVVSSRSTEDSYVSEQGTESEWKVNKVRIYLFDNTTKEMTKTFLVNKLTKTNDGAQGYVVYTSDKVNVPSGTFDVFAVANTDDVINSKTEGEFINNVNSSTYSVALITNTANGIVMSNRASANMGVAIAGGEEQDNVVDITLERVAARLDVARSAASYEMKDGDGNVYASVSLKDFHYVNLPKSYYTFRHVATLTSLTEPQWNINTHFGNVGDVNGYVIDPYFFSKVSDATSFTNADAYYENYYATYFKGSTVKWTEFKAVASTPVYNTCYSLENCSMQAAQKNAYSTGVVFRGELTTNNNIYRLSDAGELELKPAADALPATLYYFNYKFYASVEALIKAGAPVSSGMTAEDMLYFKVRTFVLEDGKYYTYYTYWIRHNDNNQPLNMGVMEFGIVRNNLYRMLVTRISDLGAGVPVINPDTPDEGETSLKVELNVKPWVVRDQTNIVL